MLVGEIVDAIPQWLVDFLIEAFPSQHRPKQLIPYALEVPLVCR